MLRVDNAKPLEEEEVFLGALKKDYMDAIRKWRNDPLLRRYFREYREITELHQEAWFGGLNNTPRVMMFAILQQRRGLLSSDQGFTISIPDSFIIGVCGLTSIDWRNRRAEVSLYIGENSVYIDDRAYAALNILIRYAFGELNLHRLYAEVFSFDVEKRGLLVTSGFSREGVLREHHYHEGDYVDSLQYGLLREDIDSI